MKNMSNSVFALIILGCATGLMVFLFVESRNDPSLRIAALVSGTGLVASLGSIASTILTGKDVTRSRDPSAMPPNSTTTDTSTVQVGPVDPTQPKP